MVVVDTHCHLDFPQFDKDREAVIARMREAGVVWALLVAVHPGQVARLQEMAAAQGWGYAIGLHPNESAGTEPTVEALCALAEDARCVAIGETGLDFYRERTPRAVQEARLRTHIRAARELGKPLVIHMREAEEATLAILEEEDAGKAGGVMHCFSASEEAAKRALALGFFISFAGNLTYPRNEALRAVARTIPAERLLVETDAPYLAPQPVRGRRNEPAFVRHTLARLARIRGEDEEALARQTTENAMRLFGFRLEEDA